MMPQAMRSILPSNTGHAIKASLISALIFPGAGHWYLKHKKAGAAIMAVSGVCLYLVMQAMVQKINQVRDQVMSGDLTLGPEALAALDSGETSLSMVSSIFMVVWLIALVDAFRIGRMTPVVSE